MKRKTIERSVSIGGFGLHSGQYTEITLSPSERGIIFVHNNMEIPAIPENVFDTRLNTTIGKDDVRISTVEHIMSALYGLGITDCRIEVRGEELPSMDGSALPFIRMIQNAGRIELDDKLNPILIEHPLEVNQGNAWIRVDPGPFSLKYTIDFEEPSIGRQSYLFKGKAHDSYIKDIAPARTFGRLSDIERMRSMGLALGGGFHNAVLFTREHVLNPEGLRFVDECVRHKILDILGDLWLLGTPVTGEIQAYRANHQLHLEFALRIIEHINGRR